MRMIWCGLGLLFAVAAQAASPALVRCFERQDCRFQLWGAGTEEPLVMLSMPRATWATIPEADRQWLRDSLRQQVLDARRDPAQAMALLDGRIPPTAPFYRRALANVRRTAGYVIVLNTERMPGGAWRLGQETERGVVPR